MGSEKLTKEEKAAKKAKKEEKKAKKREAEVVEEEKPAKKPKGEETEEERAARKAAKKAAKKSASEFAPPPAEVDVKAEKKAKKAKAAVEAAVETDAPTPKTAAEGSVEGNNRVYVGNLPFSMTEDWMKEEFSSAGSVTNIDWLTHSDTGRFKGAVFVTFSSKEEADKAIGFNGKELEGRPMKVELATPKKSGPPGGFAGSGDPGEPSESIFCGNLSWSITEENLRSTFSSCGEISRIKWLEKDGEFKGICFIDFATVEDNMHVLMDLSKFLSAVMFLYLGQGLSWEVPLCSRRCP